MWDIGDELKASEYMVDKWLSLSNNKVYKQWPASIASGFIDKPSLFDTSPGLKTFRGFLDEFSGFKRRISATAADINSGKSHVMTDLDTDFSEFHYAVTSSASIPGVFPPISF